MQIRISEKPLLAHNICQNEYNTTADVLTERTAVVRPSCVESGYLSVFTLHSSGFTAGRSSGAQVRLGRRREATAAAPEEVSVCNDITDIKFTD